MPQDNNFVNFEYNIRIWNNRGMYSPLYWLVPLSLVLHVETIPRLQTFSLNIHISARICFSFVFFVCSLMSCLEVCLGSLAMPDQAITSHVETMINPDHVNTCWKYADARTVHSYSALMNCRGFLGGSLYGCMWSKKQLLWHFSLSCVSFRFCV